MLLLLLLLIVLLHNFIEFLNLFIFNYVSTIFIFCPWCIPIILRFSSNCIFVFPFYFYSYPYPCHYCSSDFILLAIPLQGFCPSSLLLQRCSDYFDCVKEVLVLFHFCWKAIPYSRSHVIRIQFSSYHNYVLSMF